jgi:rRNA pseudouridine-1189 N-methylase Emg1 (Nep1/Mra1 family)
MKTDNMNKPRILYLACSVFKNELERLIKDNRLQGYPLEFLDSKLHLHPDQMYQKLQEIITEKLKEYNGIVLIYGECHAFMNELLKDTRLARPEGINCVELFIGKAERKRLLHRGAFFLLPEWSIRWREIFNHFMNMNNELTKLIMQNEHKTLIYLDTGCICIPEKQLKECAEYFSLPIEIVKISLDEFAGAINNATNELKKRICNNE